MSLALIGKISVREQVKQGKGQSKVLSGPTSIANTLSGNRFSFDPVYNPSFPSSSAPPSTSSDAPNMLTYPFPLTTIQPMDPRLAPLLYNSAMGLPHGYPDRSVRGTRWTRERGGFCKKRNLGVVMANLTLYSIKHSRCSSREVWQSSLC